MILDLNHADIPSCADCKQWLYEPDKDWKPTLCLGQRVPRNGAATPCWKCPKGPVPFENEPTRTTLLTIDYYHKCQADVSGILPRDRRVIDDQALIARIREQAQRQTIRSLPIVALMPQMKGAK